MASWGWFFIAALVYNLCWYYGYKAGYKKGAWDVFLRREQK